MDYNHEKVFDIILIFGLVALVIVFLQLNPQQPALENARMSECIQDSDCALVDENCCACENGGSKTSVNKFYIGYWNDRLYKQCLDTPCSAPAASQNPTCFAEAKCIKNNCVAWATL
jgi:hypothetical protein